jgi:hypothetical protein
LLQPVASTNPMQAKAAVAVERGGQQDSFWGNTHSSWSHLSSNSNVFAVIKSGTDQEVLNLSNTYISSPTTTKSCAEAAEQSMVGDLATMLALDMNIRNKATIKRYTSVLPDRICMGCAWDAQNQVVIEGKRAVSCKAGTMLCGNCQHKVSSLQDWVAAGCPCRHMA